MIILTNGLTDVADEGFLKVANSLVKRLKAQKNVHIITYDRQSPLSDVHLTVNKLLLNKGLIASIRSRKEPVLYIPFPAKTMATALRVFVLSFFARRGLSVVWVQKAPLNALAKLLVKLSRAKLIVFAKETADYFAAFIGKARVQYLKTGVDTQRFRPVSRETVQQLKVKYGFDPQRPVVLHVGHLKNGRNIGKLLDLHPHYQVLLVVSTLFRDQQDLALRQRFLSAPNVRLIEDYVPEIQEVYQLADVYFFPVVEKGNCIDVPLSCLEAAACNKPVVTTDYGEMKAFSGKDGFVFIDSFDAERLNALVTKALQLPDADIRAAVLSYDWNCAIESLT